MKDDIILQVENLHTGFLVDNVPLEAVSGVSFSLKAGRVLGVVGESGCGKSVTAHSIMQLLQEMNIQNAFSCAFTISLHSCLEDYENSLAHSMEMRL